MQDVSLYIKEINRYKLLSRKEEAALAKEFQAGDRKAYQQLVNANLRFVVKLANQYSSYKAQLPDLIQEGNIGLMSAAEKFDPDRGCRLITYAAWWIRANINQFILKSHSIVSISRTMANRKLFFKLRSVRAKMTVDGQEPSTEELAKKLLVKEHNVEEMSYRLASRDFSANMQVVGGEATYLDLVSDKSPSQDEVYSKKEKNILVRTKIWKVLGKFDERERYIIMNRLMTDEPEIYRKIGLKFSISRVRVQQIELKLIGRLRNIFENTELRPAA